MLALLPLSAVAQTTLSPGTAVDVYSVSSSSSHATAAFDGSNAITCYQGSSPTSGRCAHVGLSGTTITVGNSDTFNSASSGSLAASAFDSTNAVVCYYDTSGNCVHIGRSGTTISSQAEVQFNSGIIQYTSTAAFDSTNAVVCYKDGDGSDLGGNCAHIGRSGTTLTIQTEVEFESEWVFVLGAAAFDSTNAVVCYALTSSAKCAHIGRSGTTISYQTAVTISGSTGTSDPSVAAFDSTNAVVCYGKFVSGSSVGKCAHIGRSGTTISYQTAVEFESGSVSDLRVTAFDSTNAIVCYRDVLDSNKGKCVHIGRSGTTLTMQSPVVFETGSTAYIAATAFDADNAYVTFQDSGDSKSKGILIQRTTDSSGGTVGDPHLSLAHGGKADFRGLHNTAFNFLSVPGLSISVRTVARDFVRWATGGIKTPLLMKDGVYAQPLGQVVHGSFIDAVYVRAHSKMTGADVLIAIPAEQTRSFRLYRYNPTSSESFVHSNARVRGGLPENPAHALRCTYCAHCARSMAQGG